MEQVDTQFTINCNDKMNFKDKNNNREDQDALFTESLEINNNALHIKIDEDQIEEYQIREESKIKQNILNSYSAKTNAFNEFKIPKIESNINKSINHNGNINNGYIKPQIKNGSTNSLQLHNDDNEIKVEDGKTDDQKVLNEALKTNMSCNDLQNNNSIISQRNSSRSLVNDNKNEQSQIDSDHHSIISSATNSTSDIALFQSDVKKEKQQIEMNTFDTEGDSNYLKLSNFNNLHHSDSSIIDYYTSESLLSPNVSMFQRRVKSDLALRVTGKPPKSPLMSPKFPHNTHGVNTSYNNQKRGSLDSNRNNIMANNLAKLKQSSSTYTLNCTSDTNCNDTSNNRQNKNDNVKISFPDNDRHKIKSINSSPRRSANEEIDNNEKNDIEEETHCRNEKNKKMSANTTPCKENENKSLSNHNNIEISELKKDLERIRNKLLLYEKKQNVDTTNGSISFDDNEDVKLNNYNNNKNTDNNATPPSIPHSILKNTNTETKLAELTPQQRANRNRVIINIGGIRHETYRSTLKNIPDTRLSWIAEESAVQSPEYDPITGEFFFDRHPQVFSHVLNYYRTGNLHVPYDVCGPLYEDELQYWGIDDSQVESCCWLTYRQHRDAQETLKEFEGIEFEKDFDDESEPDLSKYGFAVDDSESQGDDLTCYQKWQPLIWNFLEDPYSSNRAKVFAYVSMSLIIFSVLLFCLETMKYFDTKKAKLVFSALDGCCVAFFTLELLLRFLFCPEKILFLKGAMNWIDFLAIIPFFINIALEDIGFVQSVRVIRVFRIIKLSKHSVGLQILGHTLKASFRELLLLIFFLIIGIVIFSSLVYYCEREVYKTEFTSIPTTFWWAVITMTTVGYGDMVPTTMFGKIFGGLCSVSGVLMIALPVPVIVNNFNLYYSHAQARLKLPKKKRRMLCGAANALKGPAMEEFERRDEEDDDDSGSNGSIPRINMPRASINSLRSLKSNDSAENLSENNLAALRMKKFGRRDSNMFTANSNASIKTSDSSTNQSNNRTNYATNKRRSLLPTMSSLPEIEH